MAQINCFVIGYIQIRKILTNLVIQMNNFANSTQTAFPKFAPLTQYIHEYNISRYVGDLLACMFQILFFSPRDIIVGAKLNVAILVSLMFLFLRRYTAVQVSTWKGEHRRHIRLRRKTASIWHLLAI